MEIIGEFLGFDTDKGIWCYFKTHWQSWFPALGSRSNFARPGFKPLAGKANDSERNCSQA